MNVKAALLLELPVLQPAVLAAIKNQKQLEATH
jgi:hypothetical protein